MKYRSFSEARKFVRKLGLKTQKEWRAYYNSGKKPADIPSRPDKVYKEFTTLGNWIGTGRISNQEKSKHWISYDDASNACKKAGIKSQTEFENASKNRTLPKGIPTHPEKTYEGKGWIDMGTFLGTGKKFNQKRVYWSFKKARSYVQKLKLKNDNEWRIFCRSGKLPTKIPQNPKREYKEFTTLGNWIGTGNVANQLREVLSYEEAEKQAHILVNELGINSKEDWIAAKKAGKIPDNLPSQPWSYYTESFTKKRRKK